MSYVGGKAAVSWYCVGCRDKHCKSNGEQLLCVAAPTTLARTALSSLPSVGYRGKCEVDCCRQEGELDPYEAYKDLW